MENFERTNDTPVSPEKIPEEVSVVENEGLNENVLKEGVKKNWDKEGKLRQEGNEDKAAKETACEYDEAMNKINGAVEFFMTGRGGY